MRRRWLSILDGPKKKATLALAMEVAHRIRDASTRSTTPSFGLANGNAGLAMIWGQFECCFPGLGWGGLAHDNLVIAATALSVPSARSYSLFGGLTGVAFAANYLSDDGRHYQELLTSLDKFLIEMLQRPLSELKADRHGMPASSFDIVSGLSGVCAYLLSRRSRSARPVLDDVLDCLISLADETNGIPHWHVPPEMSHMNDFMSQEYPYGYLNCGLAHGIPGPLAALSLARIAGIKRKSIEDAIAYMARWLMENRLDDVWGINWPYGVSLHRPHQNTKTAHAGWCYGSPGIARSLYLAGRALGHREHIDFAIAAMEAIFRRPEPARLLKSPTYCHGLAGLLQITVRFLNESPTDAIATGASKLVNELAAHFDSSAPYGFRSIEHDGQTVDRTALLDGAGGVAAVLLSATCDVEPAWDRAFLLS